MLEKKQNTKSYIEDIFKTYDYNIVPHSTDNATMFNL